LQNSPNFVIFSHVSEKLNQIFTELDTLSDMIAVLRANAGAANRQTDLEVAILTQQIQTLREQRKLAAEYVEESLSILDKLRKAD